jgi:hypothetical protein
VDEPLTRTEVEMAWSGSWNADGTVFTGTYTAPDGSVFAGTWTLPAQVAGMSDPPGPVVPPLSDYDPYTHGVGPRVDGGDGTSRPVG